MTVYLIKCSHCGASLVNPLSDVDDPISFTSQEEAEKYFELLVGLGSSATTRDLFVRDEWKWIGVKSGPDKTHHYCTTCVKEGKLF